MLSVGYTGVCPHGGYKVKNPPGKWANYHLYTHSVSAKTGECALISYLHYSAGGESMQVKKGLISNVSCKSCG